MSWSMRDERVQTQLREYRGQGQLKEIGILLLGTIGITPLAIDVCTLWEKKKKALKKKKRKQKIVKVFFSEKMELPLRLDSQRVLLPSE